ncbi:head completion/stabilization protein [Pseudomonas sp. LS1212]|uniref:head completion/stabilization protein n=1 Tax=Pseudomonas sp. LS1212 TaxID=2972478 RepID=UPI00215CC54A|nr:head completion/stabilization protein [Pseudomonas sp. LS1212]UVJ43136.1 head completion/stabilization protein [Pseudomonas sp. LS1212]
MESLHDNYPDPAYGQLRAINPDPFWPRIDLDELRARLGSIDDISDARLAVAAIGAAERVNREFGKWRAVLRGKGYARLEDLSGGSENRSSSLFSCYSKAIDASVRRELEQHLRVVDCQPNGVRRRVRSTTAISGVCGRD